MGEMFNLYRLWSISAGWTVGPAFGMDLASSPACREKQGREAR